MPIEGRRARYMGGGRRDDMYGRGAAREVYGAFGRMDWGWGARRGYASGGSRTIFRRGAQHCQNI